MVGRDGTKAASRPDGSTPGHACRRRVRFPSRATAPPSSARSTGSAVGRSGRDRAGKSTRGCDGKQTRVVMDGKPKAWSRSAASLSAAAPTPRHPLRPETLERNSRRDCPTSTDVLGRVPGWRPRVGRGGVERRSRGSEESDVPFAGSGSRPPQRSEQRVRSPECPRTTGDRGSIGPGVAGVGSRCEQESAEDRSDCTRRERAPTDRGRQSIDGSRDRLGCTFRPLSDF